MTAILDNGQLYFTFEELENMSFDELAQIAKKIRTEKVVIAKQLAELHGLEYLVSPLHVRSADLTHFLVDVCELMLTKSWEV